MSRKIIGVTVGTPISASTIDEKLKPVKTVNGITPDEKGNVQIEVGSGGDVDLTGYATEQYVQGYAQPKGNYLTEVPAGYAKTEDISATINSALAQAKESGEFKGEDGESGVYILSEGESIEDAPDDADVVIAPNSDDVLDLSVYALKTDIPTDAHITGLINTALGVIENGTY